MVIIFVQKLKKPEAEVKLPATHHDVGGGR